MAAKTVDAEIGRIKASMRQQSRRRVRVGATRASLYSYVSVRCHQYPSEQRVLLAAQGQPLPSERCDCEPTRRHEHHCRGKKFQGWPVGYRRGGMSYECWLHRQSEWFLRNLPSSSSVVRLG